jgi:hypothetical protein
MSTEKEEHLRNMSLTVLVAQYVHELHAAARGEIQDDSHWGELLRRATVEREDAACEALLDHLHRIVRGWMVPHPHEEITDHLEREADYVVRVCELFWQAAPKEEPALRRLSTALQYVRASLNGVILGVLREHARSKVIPEMEKPIDKTFVDGQVWWDKICKLLPGEHEQRTAYLLFHCGLTPREILRLCPEEFISLQEIFHVRGSILEQMLASEISFQDAE